MKLAIFSAILLSELACADFGSDVSAVSSAANELESRVKSWSSPDGLQAALGIQGYFPTLAAAVSSLSGDAGSVTDDQIDPSAVSSFGSAVAGLLNALAEKAGDFQSVGAASIVQGDLNQLGSPSVDIVSGIIKAVSADCSKIPSLTGALNSVAEGFTSANSAFSADQVTFPTAPSCASPTPGTTTSTPASPTPGTTTSTPASPTPGTTNSKTGPASASKSQSGSKPASGSGSHPASVVPSKSSNSTTSGVSTVTAITTITTQECNECSGKPSDVTKTQVVTYTTEDCHVCDNSPTGSPAPNKPSGSKPGNGGNGGSPPAQGSGKPGNSQTLPALSNAASRVETYLGSILAVALGVAFL